MVSTAHAASGRRGVPPGRRWGWATALGVGLLGLGPWLLRPEAFAPPPAPQARMPLPEPAPLPAPRAAPRVAEAASAAIAMPATAAVRILALRQDGRGRWLARLRVGEEPPRLAQVGDVVAPGLRVEHIAPGGVLLRRGGALEPVAFAGPLEPPDAPPRARQAPAPSVIVSPPGREAPSSSGLERAIQRATWQAGVGTGH